MVTTLERPIVQEIEIEAIATKKVEGYLPPSQLAYAQIMGYVLAPDTPS